MLVASLSRRGRLGAHCVAQELAPSWEVRLAALVRVHGVNIEKSKFEILYFFAEKKVKLRSSPVSEPLWKISESCGILRK